MEDWLGLATISWLLAVITALPLGRQAVLTLLVLSDLVEGVLPALLALAVGLLGLGNIHLHDISKMTLSSTEGGNRPPTPSNCTIWNFTNENSIA
jgi:hypothetical protein